MSTKVMITATVNRSGKWSKDRTLTISAESDEAAEFEWLKQFPSFLDKALGDEPEEWYQEEETQE